MNQHPAPLASDPLHEVIATFLAKQALLPPGGPFALVVGVSGGADSVCLLHLLQTVAPALGITLYVAHVDHGLRSESLRDAVFVRELAVALGLPFHLSALDPHPLRASRSGIEAAAREARYAALCAVARNVAFPGQVPCLAVAHHSNDQAETVLLRLIQGTGVGGLGAMRPVTLMSFAPFPTDPPVRLIRPLLSTPRADLIAYLERNGLPWCIDDSNDDRHYLRNRIRHDVLPLLEEMNPAVVMALGNTAALARAEADRIERLNATTLEFLATEPITEERAVLDLEQWRTLPESERLGVLYTALRRLVPDGRELGFVQIQHLMDAAYKATHAAGPHPLPCQLAWTIVGAPMRLCLHRATVLPIAVRHPWLDAAWRREFELVEIPMQGEIAVGEWRLHISPLSGTEAVQAVSLEPSPWQVFLDADRIGMLQLTPPKPGMKLAPLGMGGLRKNVGDLFTDAKVPPPLRIGWPIIVDDSARRVLWVCGIRPTEDARLSPDTQHAVWLRWSHSTGAG